MAPLCVGLKIRHSDTASRFRTFWKLGLPAEATLGVILRLEFTRAGEDSWEGFGFLTREEISRVFGSLLERI